MLYNHTIPHIHNYVIFIKQIYVFEEIEVTILIASCVYNWLEKRETFFVS